MNAHDFLERHGGETGPTWSTADYEALENLTAIDAHQAQADGDFTITFAMHLGTAPWPIHTQTTA